MGADFIGTLIEVPELTYTEALARLAGMSDADLDELLWDTPHDDEHGRVFFTEQLRQFYEKMLPGHDREVGMWQIDGKRYIVTGGMSWGDPPTDAYDVIEAVATLLAAFEDTP